MQEAEIGRITVPDQPGGKKSLGDPHLIGKELDVMVCACHFSYCGKHKQKDCSPGQPGQKQDPIANTTGGERVKVWLKW
jgi:hypothetical protein